MAALLLPLLFFFGFSSFFTEMRRKDIRLKKRSFICQLTNLRLIDRLMMQVQHILTANDMTVVTKEVVETARENLIIGPN